LRRVRVHLGARSYPIRIAPGLLGRVGEETRTLSRASHAFLLSDANVHALYGPAVERSLRKARFRVTTFTIPPGERSKSLASLRRVYDAFVEAGAERGTLFLALGGGVVGDLAGFAAATWHRGAPVVQLPTSLLAQVDSSVGGKTGVNLPAGKNLIGAFHQPAAVLIDTTCLATLPAREYAAGLGEVVKYGMIRDRRLFRLLEERAGAVARRDPSLLGRLVAHCCRIKAEYVAADERDLRGRRAHLNYGHTFGHAVETATAYGRYLHGEAVALGMIAAETISRRLGRTTAGDGGRLLRLLETLSLPTGGVRRAPEELLPLLWRDKKAREGRLRIVLTKGIGSASVSESVSRPLLLRGLREICGSSRSGRA